jgi:hypothetical protein
VTDDSRNLRSRSGLIRIPDNYLSFDAQASPELEISVILRFDSDDPIGGNATLRPWNRQSI